MQEKLLSVYAAEFIFQISQEKDIDSGIALFHKNILI